MSRLVVRVLPAALLVLSSLTATETQAHAGASRAQPQARTQTQTAGWTAPLSTRGRYIVDAAGERFKLKSGNWHGASGTWNGEGDAAADANHHAGENAHRIPMGLDRAPIDEIVASFAELGLNSVRLPFSNEMIRDVRPVADADVAANPQLRGRTPLQVYDAVVTALTGAGLAVILNNHTNTTRWCCGVDGNERWNSAQAAAVWEQDWVFMAARYRGNPRVVGADLYNEVRRDVLDDPNWGLGDAHDWFAASQRAGERILAEGNPNLLIIVEGINWYGLPVDGFDHGRPTLTPVARLSHTLTISGKLVYSAHFYDYTGSRHSGATGIGETTDPRYRDLSRDELFATLYREAFYVAAESGRHFTAPVWISEFGVGPGTGTAQRAWFGAFVDYLIQRDADFAYWPMAGWTEARVGNGWALIHWDRSGTRSTVRDGGDWRATDWNRLVAAPGLTGPVAPVARWSMLSPDHGDFVQSPRMRAAGDWDAGARKAACPDGQRLIGLSGGGNRGLCTDSGGAAPAGAFAVVRDERHVDPDWAGGYTKFQCPAGHVMTGYAVRGAAVSSVLCTAAPVGFGAGRTVWFDRGDNRPAGDPGGEFAHQRHKGQCTDGEYAAGVAFTRRIGSSGAPAALLCRPLG
ncbi:aryl-phospho-beta-D-glucosidase BglC (GH1 family) [Catenuloplanes nepalensis]|uniref:Aryl-phospho-beta-D-glucosidase BglC (GH1 family) n=1 Tax=Catenuloplanes nepalensis TaxID=587533 RepID=A0ABT9MPQ1_9ACTN|nr:cellulase family glycosylhydrolase [Catenuloplanes nepalensis]MDP9793390.1 aryl-phospho-beta-D-glucosidase BglC (GH1 family) [Catenuloplanes nepalensis]